MSSLSIFLSLVFLGSSSSTTPWWQSWVIEQSPSNASKGSPFLKCVGSISWDFFSSRMSLFLKSWCPFWRTFYDERVDFIGSSGLSRLVLWNWPVFEEKIPFSLGAFGSQRSSGSTSLKKLSCRPEISVPWQKEGIFPSITGPFHNFWKIPLWHVLCACSI